MSEILTLPVVTPDAQTDGTSFFHKSFCSISIAVWHLRYKARLLGSRAEEPEEGGCSKMLFLSR